MEDARGEEGHLVFHLTKLIEVDFILKKCSWSPCNGFLLIKDGLWSSTDLSSTSIWIRALACPIKFLIEVNAAKLAASCGRILEVQSVLKNKQYAE
ncbi:hypothetical protein PanWU01x14_254290 [Parasponia andersonii]|uniref:DUF4283 domain-containing protein n=1 Tax=Parasponia andersonii TaxID=3476 RepID=A0A2P5BBG3_PARAD|nr:hypothetical protein PanWU01x14_254290 [Parasponia andersonii]